MKFSALGNSHAHNSKNNRQGASESTQALTPKSEETQLSRGEFGHFCDKFLYRPENKNALVRKG